MTSNGVHGDFPVFLGLATQRLAQQRIGAGNRSVLKNALDWLSRVKPSPLSGKPVLLVGASPGALGAVRGLWHSRQPLDALGCHVFPNMMGISKAHEAFDTNDALLDAKLAQQLDALVISFLEHASRTAR